MMTNRAFSRVVPLVAMLTLVSGAMLHAQAVGKTTWVPQLLGAQFTGIMQDLEPFSAQYSGTNSLLNTGQTKGTHTYGAYFGSQVLPWLQLYADVEMARGKAVSKASGLGGITNGDVLRQGTVDLGQSPYLARVFVRMAWSIGDGDATKVERGIDQLAGTFADERIEVKGGLLATTDDFDNNRYANSTRTQFMNWGLFNNTAWDYAANTRGYTRGIVVGIVKHRWSLHAGTFQMPTFANGNTFDSDVRRARGDNIELALRPTNSGTVVRLLAYQNHARMGIYAEAIAKGQATGTTPNIVADDQPGRRKYGFGINIEQPIADGGETGAFLRAGWSDGKTESFAFTEVDQAISVGGQLDGVHWGREDDRLGIALVRHGLSADHQAYLAAGGLGFVLGDGQLNYAHETIFEAYYRIQVGRFVQVGPDIQRIWNPGYNADRGPVTVASARVNIRY